MAVELTEKEQQARSRVCFALDFPTTQAALDATTELGPYIGLFKIGMELHTAASDEGVPIIRRIYEASGGQEGRVFVDLKFHDTPNTVYGASKALAIPPVRMFNIHVAGGEKMCRKAVEGAYEGAQARNTQRPYVIGLTVLTSLDDKDIEEQGMEIKYDALVRRRTELAKKWGLDGVICPANKAGALEREFGSDFLYVTPGIEWAGIHREGQKQLYTPDMAVRDCSNSVLVIGGAIAKSQNRPATAYEILQAMAAHL